MFKRLLPVAGVLGLLSVVLAGSAAAGGGGYGGPGLFKLTDLSANANLVDPATGYYSTFVYVDRGAQTFKAKHTPGAPVTQVNGTVLNVKNENGYGCWIIPDSAFVVAHDLSGARVNVHATADMQCPGYYVGDGTGGKPGLQGSIGFGGGGGGGQITDIIVDLTWTGSSALWTYRNSTVAHCQSFTATSNSTSDYEYSTATGTVGDETNVSDPLAQVARFNATSNANSNPSGACNPFGY